MNLNRVVILIFIISSLNNYYSVCKVDNLPLEEEAVYIKDYPSTDRTSRLINPFKYELREVRLAIENNSQQILGYISKDIKRVAECIVTLSRLKNLYRINEGKIPLENILKLPVNNGRVPFISRYELELLGTTPFEWYKVRDEFEDIPTLAQKQKSNQIEFENDYKILLEKITKVKNKYKLVTSIFISYMFLRFLKERSFEKTSEINLDSILKYLSRTGKFNDSFYDLFEYTSSSKLADLKNYITDDNLSKGKHYHRGFEIFLTSFNSKIIHLTGTEEEIITLSFITYLCLIYKYKIVTRKCPSKNSLSYHIKDDCIYQAAVKLQEHECKLCFRTKLIKLDTGEELKPEDIDPAQYMKDIGTNEIDQIPTPAEPLYGRSFALADILDVAGAYANIQKSRGRNAIIDAIFTVLIGHLIELRKQPESWVYFTQTRLPDKNLTDSERRIERTETDTFEVYINENLFQKAKVEMDEAKTENV